MKTENTMAMVLAAAVGALCSYCAQLVVPLAVLVVKPTGLLGKPIQEKV